MEYWSKYLSSVSLFVKEDALVQNSFFLAVLFFAALLLVPLLLVFLRLDDWQGIYAHFTNTKEKSWVRKLKIYFLDRTGFNYRLYLVVLIFGIYGLLDYWDQWSRIPIKNLNGLGFVNGPEELVLYLTLLTLLISTIENYRLRDITYESVGEAKKANELQLRPYLSLHWDSNYVGDNRRQEHITDTCLIVRNDGAGLMKRVSYNIQVNDQEVLVRGHNIITPGKEGSIITYSLSNNNKLLGDRNDVRNVANNNQLIREGIRTARVSGEYADLNGTEYKFSFERDDNEQSWFKETSQQAKE